MLRASLRLLSIVVLGAVLLVYRASAWAASSATGPEAAPPKGEILKIETRRIADLKAVFATVESVREVKARARIGGTVTGLEIREGDRVTEDQVIATVRDPKLPLQIAAADARILSLDAQERQKETDLARAQQLRATGSGSQQRLDDAQTALDVVRAQIAASKADRSVLEQQRREGDVLAPTTGRVLRVPLVDGAVIQPGEAVAIITTETYVLRLRLPERHARFIKEGDPVLVGARGLAPADATFELKPATVRLVYPELVEGQVVADAEADGLGNYFVGERVRVLVASGGRETIVIPPSFLVRRAGVDFVRLADGHEVPVQLGRPVPATGEHRGGIEILSGLKAGDEIRDAEGRP